MMKRTNQSQILDLLVLVLCYLFLMSLMPSKQFLLAMDMAKSVSKGGASKFAGI